MLHQYYKTQQRYVVGPDGSPLTINDLPPTGTTRWTIRRKATLVAAIQGGLITLDDACARYDLSTDEFMSWRRSIQRDGLRALRTTRIQDYRK